LAQASECLDGISGIIGLRLWPKRMRMRLEGDGNKRLNVSICLKGAKEEPLRVFLFSRAQWVTNAPFFFGTLIIEYQVVKMPGK
jgi:hypothetical protein